MKGFFFGLTAGLAAGVVAQMMIAKNHEQMLELVKNIPKSPRFSTDTDLDELQAQKERLDEIIRQKKNEASFFTGTDFTNEETTTEKSSEETPQADSNSKEAAEGA